MTQQTKQQTQQTPKPKHAVHAFTGSAGAPASAGQHSRPTNRNLVARLWCGDAGIKPEAVDDAGTVTLANGATVSLMEVTESCDFGQGHAAFIAAIQQAAKG